VPPQARSRGARSAFILPSTVLASPTISLEVFTMAGTSTGIPRAPSGLGKAGRKLWRVVAGTYELRPDETAHLEAACRATDLAATIADELAEHGVTTVGSKGQPRASGLLKEWRDTMELRARLLARIDIPEAAGVWDNLSASQRARKAAIARWDKRGA
jgi:hypothetical protein